MGQMLAAASEDLNAKFVLEQPDLFADARLRREKALSGGRHIEVVVCDFPDIAKLLEFHGDSSESGVPDACPVIH